MLQQVVDFLASISAEAEGTLFLSAIILDGFERSIQLDGWNCGAYCAYMILKYHGKARSLKNVQKEAGTTEDGTDEEMLIKLFRKRGLSVYEFEQRSLAKLERAIDRGSPILAHISTRIENHWVVVYGYDDDYIWIADPSLNVLKHPQRVWCRQTRSSFRNRWKGYGIVVGKKKRCSL
ncbi:MAG: cysteine peptidase family C39 domain-containing protein [Bacteroidota bacterium]